MNKPLVTITIFYVTGILLGEFTDCKSSAALTLAAFCFIVAGVSFMLNWRQKHRVVLVLFLLLGLFMSRLWVEESRTTLLNYNGQRVVLSGLVVSEADVREDKVFYLLAAQEISRGKESRKITGTVRLQVKESDVVYAYGDILRVSGLITYPDHAGNPGGFDYRNYLERQGIRVVLMARGNEAVRKIGEDVNNPLLGAALFLKKKLAAAATASLTPSQAAVLNGIIFGTQGLIDREIRQTFAETGVVHILSVSGLHVGLLLGGFVGLLRLLRVPPELTAPLATPVLVFYALMTGLIPAVLRATTMALLLLWAHHLGRERDWPTTLALAALAILLWNPLQLYNPGFQLSFAATWGILYLGPYFTDICSGLLKWLPAGPRRTAAQALSIPLSAQIATIPLVAWYYNMITPISIPANLLAVPLVGMILLFGIFASLLGLVWLPLAVLVNAGTAVVLDLFLALVGYLQQVPGAVFYLTTPPVILSIAWYGLLIILVEARSDRWNWREPGPVRGWIAVGAALSITLLLVWWPWSGAQKLTVHFLDVGQGDSILIQTPGGRNLLIDTGGRPEEFIKGGGVGEQVVVPYLRRAGVHEIDALVLTHPHEDHAGGAAALAKNFPIALAVVSPSAAGDIPAAYTALLEQMASGGTPVRVARGGDTLRLDGKVGIEVLAPEKTAGVRNTDLNNNSLVIKVTYGKRSFVFTGDVELEAQKKLMGIGEMAGVDVFKLPHHGSRNLLPELVERVNPRAAVISVGAHNTFGHPAQSTLDLLYKTGTAVYRTDLDGAVIIQTDGNNLEIKTGRRAY